MNKETYELLEKELTKNRIQEEAEEVLLELAETIQEKGVPKKEVNCKVNFGRNVVEGCGFVESDGLEEEESVFIKWVKLGKVTIEINDYLI